MSSKLLTLLRRRGDRGLSPTRCSTTRSLLDDAAPITSPRTCEPGPGLLLVVDTENKLSISNLALACTGGKASPAYGDPGVWLARQTPALLLRKSVAGYAAVLVAQAETGATFLKWRFDPGASGSPVNPNFYLVGGSLHIESPQETNLHKHGHLVPLKNSSRYYGRATTGLFSSTAGS